MLIQIVFATILVSLPSLLGGLAIFSLFKEKDKVSGFLISFASGTMLGGAFLHLLPEGAEMLEVTQFSQYVLATIVIYFLMDTLLHWHHCSTHSKEHGDCNEGSHKSLSIRSLIGDGVHNFIDGILIAGSFIASPALGITTTLAVVLHEIPQELGDFGILIHAGYSKQKAALANLSVGLLSVLGGTAGWWLVDNGYLNMGLLFAIATGNFIFIALSDLIPEVRKHENRWVQFLLMLLGIGMMALL